MTCTCAFSQGISFPLCQILAVVWIGMHTPWSSQCRYASIIGEQVRRARSASCGCRLLGRGNGLDLQKAVNRREFLAGAGAVVLGHVVEPRVRAFVSAEISDVVETSSGKVRGQRGDRS